jgi:predicted RNA-binding protein YlxR (DUF448 family)
VPKTRHEPVRTCVACRLEAGKRELVRLFREPGGRVRVDSTGRSPGRGAYLHPDRSCIELARRRGTLERALRGAVGEETWAELAARG